MNLVSLVVARARMVVVVMVTMLVATSLAFGGVSSPASAVSPANSGYLRMAAVTNGGGDAEQSYTTAEAVALAERFDLAVGLRWTFDSEIDAMRAANAGFRMFAYMNGAFSKPKDAGAMPDAWFLKDASGAKVTSVKWGNFYMDPANQGWRDWVAQRCADWTSLSGFDGCMMDDLGSGNLTSGNLSATPIDPRTGALMTTGDWIGYTSGLAQYVGDANPGILVSANGLNNGPRFFGKGVDSKRLLESVDMAIAEGFLRNEYWPADKFRNEADWQAEVDMLVEAGVMGKSILLQTKIWSSAPSSDIEHWRRYSYATLLLGTNGESYLNFNPEGPGKPPAVHAWESIDIGTPTEAYAKLDGVYQRRYTGGIAMVNPTDSAVLVTLDQAYERLDGSTVTAFSLGANDGEILQTTTVAPPSDVTPADGVVDAPLAGDVLVGPGVVVSGSASDDVGVVGVDVAVRDTVLGMWLQSDGVTFGSSYATVPAVLDTPGGLATGWSFGVSLPDGDYAVQVTAVDAAGNVDATPPWVPFSVASSSPDVTPADGVVDAPLPREVLIGSAVVVSGSASDDVGVAAVDVAVRDRIAKTWLQADGVTFASSYATLPAVLDTPGGVVTGWSFGVSLPDGDYAVQVKAVDAAGNVDPTPPWVPFTVSSSAPDVTPPDGVVVTPGKGDVLVGPGVVTSGTATDDVGVAVVKVAVRDRIAKTWLQADGVTFGSSYATVPAVLDTPGGVVTGWSFGVSLPDGDYAVQVTAVDAAGNSDPTPPWIPFAVGPG